MKYIFFLLCLIRIKFIISVDVVEIYSGSCSSISKEGCMQYAVQVNDKLTVININISPPGCYYKPSGDVGERVWYNEAASTTSCNSERICICNKNLPTTTAAPATTTSTDLPTTTAAPATTTSTEGVELTCDESEMEATFNEIALKGSIYDIGVTGCDNTSYVVNDFTVTIMFKDCAKNISEGADEIVQENEVTLVTGYKDAVIERIVVNYFKLQCKFDRRTQVSTAFAVDVKDKQESFEEAKITQFAAQLTIYESDAFSVIATDPFEVVAYQPINMQITGLNKNELYKFVVESCFATPDGDVNNAMKYLFFTSKCPLDPSYKEIEVGDNKYSFSIEAFTFIKVVKKVWFHCNLYVCKKDSKSPECTQTCEGVKRRRRAISSRPIESVHVRSAQIKWRR